MTTYTYEQIYADACKGIIRSEADASLAGRHNGADCVVVVDRKCGECTPSEPEVDIWFTNNTANYSTTKKITNSTSGISSIYDESGTRAPHSSIGTISQYHNGTEWNDNPENGLVYKDVYGSGSYMLISESGTFYVSAIKVPREG